MRVLHVQPVTLNIPSIQFCMVKIKIDHLQLRWDVALLMAGWTLIPS
jgi:hypothetical protein